MSRWTRSTVQWINQNMMSGSKEAFNSSGNLRRRSTRFFLRDSERQVCFFTALSVLAAMEKREPSTPYTVFSERRKKWTIAIASLVTFVSPVSSNIYYPALNDMASDLHVSSSDINLTITAFMVSLTAFSLSIHPRY